MLSAFSSVRMIVAFGPSIVVMVWLISKLTWYWRHQPDLRFGWLLLLLVIYVLWEHRAAFATAPPGTMRTCSAWILAAVGCVILFLVQIYQNAFGLNAASMVGLGLGALCIITANALYLFGAAAARRFAGALALLFLAFPMPSIVQSLVVGGLQSGVARVTVEFLNGLGIAAQRTGNIIHLANGTVGIDEACSGIRSLQSSLMIGWFVGHMLLRTALAKTGLLLMALAGAVIGNLIRSILLSCCVHTYGSATAADWHDAAGWSVLICTLTAIALSVVWVARIESSAICLRDCPGTADLVNHRGQRA